MKRVGSLLLLGVVLATGCSGDRAATPGPTAAPSATPAADVGIFAVDARGRVVVLDPSTGDEVRELAVGAEIDVFPGITLSPDASTVFFVRPLNVNEREIVSVPAAGGELVVVGAGVAPQAGPDGRLAYVATDAQTGRADTVVVREDGNERRWRLEDRPDADATAFVQSVSWAGDGRRLAALVAFEEGGAVLLVDAATQGSLWDAERVEAGPGETWNAAAFTNSDLAVVAGCCTPDFDRGWVLVSVDPDSADRETLATLAGPASGLDADGGGRLLFVSEGGLHRWDDGEPVKVADDVVAASW